MYAIRHKTDATNLCICYTRIGKDTINTYIQYTPSCLEAANLFHSNIRSCPDAAMTGMYTTRNYRDAIYCNQV
jgi:hypothetical protein